MRKFIFFLVIIHLYASIGIADHHSNPTCGDNSDRLDATAGSGKADDGYCDASETIGTNPSPKYNCLRVAVVEYSRIDGADCKKITQANLDAYEEIVRIAQKNGAKMILFPEDGILMGTARGIAPCLEEIPDPDKLTEDFNPCLQPNRFNQPFPILNKLSCLARDHGLYLIANYGTKEKKTRNASQNGIDDAPEEDSSKDEYLMLNTDVIFDPTGTLIRRYRKWNPFTETEIFAKAPKLEHVYFDTDYGRFGVFTCFDMIFKEPAVELVERFHIDTALFPTWWFDELPLLTAVQIQDGWSATNQVNLLGSNILKPSRGSLGSSIFSVNNSVYVAPEQYKNNDQVRKTKILLGTIQTRHKGHVCEGGFDPKIVEIDTNINYDKYKNKNYKLHATDVVQVLDEKDEDTKTACSDQVCCTVQFKLDQSNVKGSMEGKLVLFVRDGPRPGFYQWYEQVCAIATLKEPYKPSDNIKESLKNLEFDGDAAVSFERLSIRATFNTRYVYPSCAHNLSKLVNRDQRKFICNQSTKTTTNDDELEPRFDCELEYFVDKTNSESNKIYSFGLYGRVYEKDMKR
uniref:Pantetheinase n=1 Tax=Aceria tosichella TaxID=561515 RepID=A0A6G1SN41_9ACAR